MDKFWSIGVVPIGIILCFGPALLAYLIFDSKGEGKGLFDPANSESLSKSDKKNRKQD